MFKKNLYLRVAFYGLLAFTAVRSAYEKLETSSPSQFLTENVKLLKEAEHILKYGSTDWNYAQNLLNIIFLNDKTSYEEYSSRTDSEKPTLLYTRKVYLDEVVMKYPEFHVESENEEFAILTNK